ncbi:MAG: hypothetical protein V4672_13150 [Verrucomicrobiota bacterium]
MHCRRAPSPVYTRRNGIMAIGLIAAALALLWKAGREVLEWLGW